MCVHVGGNSDACCVKCIAHIGSSKLQGPFMKDSGAVLDEVEYELLFIRSFPVY